MKNIVKPVVKKADLAISSIYSKLRDEKNVLVTFLFHALFKNENEIKMNLVERVNGTTIDHFQQFIKYFKDHDYIFIGPDEIINELENNKKYILITFDDGYYNNQLALPILKKFDVPAVFFISTEHVQENKSFWWDVQYRERINEGCTEQELQKERETLKKKKNNEIETHLIENFGKDSLTPRGDVDRPFTSGELKKFSTNRLVHIGNHTCEHAILTNYTKSEMKVQISRAQEILHELTGKTPIIISYPNGNYSEDVIRISKNSGLKLGITVEPYKNYIPLDFDRDEQFRLGRFMLHDNKNYLEQCEAIDISLIRSIKSHQRRKH